MSIGAALLAVLPACSRPGSVEAASAAPEALAVAPAGPAAPVAASRPSAGFVLAPEALRPAFVHARDDASEQAPGAVLFDVDGDGDLDLYLVNGPAPPESAVQSVVEPEPLVQAAEAEGGRPVPPSVGRLYEWRADHFEDVTASWGLEDARFEQRGTGVCAADWDGDGDVDLFTSATGANRLLSNEGRRFRDVTDRVGLSSARGTDGEGRFDASTGAAFCDFDGDGRLDLVVCRVFPSGDLDGPCRVWRNRGDGRFGEATRGSGLDTVKGGARAVSLLDFDGDGRMDLLLAMESANPLLLRNRGAMRFENASSLLDLAGGESVSGTSCADAAFPDDDSRLAIAFGSSAGAPLRLLRRAATEPSRFAEDASAADPAPAPGPVHALAFLDADLDGRAELLLLDSSGAPQLRFEEADGPRSASALEPTPDPAPSPAAPARSFACGDVNGDGLVDLVVTERGGPARLWLGTCESDGRSLRVELRAPGSNRRAIGAEVSVHPRAPGQLTVEQSVRSAWVRTGHGGLSQHEATLTFGLGEAASADVVVRWPDGTTSRHEGLDAGRTHVLSKPGL